MKNRVIVSMIVMAIVLTAQCLYAGTIKGKVTAHGAKNAGDTLH